MKDIVRGKRARDGDQITRWSKAAWRKVTGDRRFVTNLYASLPNRLSKVVAAGGASIDY